MDDPGFSVTATGRPVEAGLWHIDAQLRFPEGILPDVGDLLLGKARFELLQAVFYQITRGQMFGATRFRISVDEFGNIQEWALPETPGEPEAAR